VTRSVRKVGFLACFLLVLLRISIGWQFLYEGLWKLESQKTSKPWSAEGYLLNARGPLRDRFRNLVNDPNGFDKLDFEKVVVEWDKWRDDFVALHADVDGIKNRVAELLEGPKMFTQGLDELPAGVDLEKFKTPQGAYLRYNAKQKRLETNLHLLPAERDALIRLAVAKPADEGQTDASAGGESAGGDSAERPVGDQPAKNRAAIKAWRDAVSALYAKSSKLSLRERLRVLLQEDPDRIGAIHEAQAGTIDHERKGKNQIYTHLLERYERDLKQAREAFQREHLENQWRTILEKRAELIGPVDALTAEFHAAAYKLLTAAESRKGPVAEPRSKIREINLVTMWSLTILGAALMAGLFSRLSALGAAALLLLFYLPMPPWPGVIQPPGPEHSLYVNKNLIEFVACLALAALPTGRWIGVDAFIRRFILRKRTD